MSARHSRIAPVKQADLSAIAKPLTPERLAAQIPRCRMSMRRHDGKVNDTHQRISNYANAIVTEIQTYGIPIQPRRRTQIFSKRLLLLHGKRAAHPLCMTGASSFSLLLFISFALSRWVFPVLLDCLQRFTAISVLRVYEKEYSLKLIQHIRIYCQRTLILIVLQRRRYLPINQWNVLRISWIVQYWILYKTLIVPGLKKIYFIYLIFLIHY